MSHLLVTNDFPPRKGGIQSYLYELWRRLPSEQTTVLTTAFDGASSWDIEQDFRIERVTDSFLAPIPKTVARINALAAEVDAELVLLDPAWPLGAIGPHLDRPYGVVLHGAEVTIPARLPFVQLALRRTLRHAALVVAAGGYPAEQGRVAAGRAIEVSIVPPGVDADRFNVMTAEQRAATRAELGIGADDLVVLGLSRLVPRKGFDVLLQASARLADHVPELKVVIAGSGRDHDRLVGLAASMSAPAQFLGEVDDDRLPALYGCADVFAMICRDRWFGLEQEGFGIVFLEAAACGVPSIAGHSGGSAEAVIDGVTGLVIDDPGRRTRLGAAARQRAASEFSYDTLALTLRDAIDRTIHGLRTPTDDPAFEHA
jgi:phosphatidylinositol alpha-1,6-mannosyltransferase